MTRPGEAAAWPAPWPRPLRDNGFVRVTEVSVLARPTSVKAPDTAADERLRSLMVGYQDGRREAFEELYVPVSDPAHVLTSHTASVVVLAAAGAALAWLASRR